MFSDVMIDIETLATSDKALVLSIGAVAFGAYEGGIDEGIHIALDPKGQPMREINADTVRWWMAQDPATRARAFTGTVGPAEALGMLAGYIRGKAKGALVWANGPQFDLVILRSLARDCDGMITWHYRDERDFRTLASVARGFDAVPPAKNTTKHDALADAMWQAEAVQKAMEAIHRG